MNDDRELFATLERLAAAGEACALVTVVRCEPPTSARPGQKAIVSADGIVAGWIGGGCAQPAVLRTVSEALGDGRPQLIRVAPKEQQGNVAGLRDFHSGCASGGTLDLFIDPQVPSPVLRIWGASPAGRHACAAAAAAGLRVQVAAPGTAPGDYPAAEAHADALDAPAEWPAPAWAVVATQGRGDQRALAAALDSDAVRIALIASRRKHNHLRARMAEREYPSTRLDAVAGPAGLDIGACTPAEIGLSIAAQIVAWRRQGAGAEVPVTATATAPTGGAGCCGD